MASKEILLRNLHTFHMAAKTLSFTLSAKTLNLTQSAVSHRIKALENELGFNLFVRGTRKLTLTPEGERFNSTLSTSLNSIFNEIGEIRTSDLGGKITLATAPNFASGWLLPRLSDFKKKHPNFNLNIIAQENTQDFSRHNIELAIFYDTDQHTNMFRQRLFGEKYIPICTPQYAKEYRLYEDGLESLHRINFIHALGSDVWQRWMKHMRLDVGIFNQFYCVSHREMSVISARHGLGVAIGRYQFVKEYLESGELVSPYPAMETHLGYDLLCPKGTEERPKIKTFIKWIESQV
ncbi:LysR substrate-binding domain-containing protein [Vibrio penaeicida]|uniref:LysR substrate-binding domain-containing protein n=1 Tax=Vibrio penaeicida TaxID=104609 RepID=UPI000CEA2F7E|nr:LysR substrate-binding domain-containing protein [Vibrio penaeicida]